MAVSHDGDEDQVGFVYAANGAILGYTLARNISCVEHP